MGEAVEVVSRASLGNEEIEALKNDCKVRIYEGNKLIRKYSSWSSVPEKIDLSAGADYRYGSLPAIQSRRRSIKNFMKG